MRFDRLVGEAFRAGVLDCRGERPKSFRTYPGSLGQRWRGHRVASIQSKQCAVASSDNARPWLAEFQWHDSCEATDQDRENRDSD